MDGNVNLNLNMEIPPPSFFEGLNKQTTQQQAETLSVAYPELSQDEIVAYVEFYNDLGIPQSAETLEKLLSGDPILPPPVTLDGVMGGVVEAKGNPWLSPNPFATFFVLFMELQSKLSEIKVAEGLVASEMINMSLDMAEDLAGLIKDIYENEAQKAIWTGIVNLAVGLISAGCTFAAFKNIGGGQAGIARAQSWGAAGSAVGQLGGAASSFISAGFDLRKAELEYAKTIVENALRVIQDRGISSAIESQKTADELISQILQKLDKIIDEAYRAHGFQVH